jgi:hypothetical protein
MVLVDGFIRRFVVKRFPISLITPAFKAMILIGTHSESCQLKVSIGSNYSLSVTKL